MYGGEEIQDRQMLIDDNVGRKILDTAIDIVNREGYDNLTIRKVAKESGCSNSAIYQRFEDKNALAEAIAALQSKPFLMIMDETYTKDVDMFTNMDRITKKLLEKLYALEPEAIYMQVVYRGRLGMDASPFVRRIERYLQNAVANGETNIANIKETAYLLSSSFWGFVQMFCVSKEKDLNKAKKLLEIQNRMLYSGIGSGRGIDALWDMLKERGVDVDKALERMKGNKDTYKNFLIEFFEDPDFDALGEAIKTGNAQNAFEYAHGLKGMAANLGLDEIRSKLSMLVEILRPGGFDGAAKAYDDVVEACRMITVLL